MRFAAPRRRRPTEAIVPMINVVFLLLIFFLMVARLAPPQPFAVVLPTGGEAAGDLARDVLYVDAKGSLFWNGLTGAAAIAAAGAKEGAVTLRADAHLPGTRLARLLGLLAVAGAGKITLVTSP
jgi:biopolymer transport protein ExbD